MEERHCIWPKVSRYYEFPAWVANGAGNRNQTAQNEKESNGTKAMCYSFFWTLSSSRGANLLVTVVCSSLRTVGLPAEMGKRHQEDLMFEDKKEGNNMMNDKRHGSPLRTC